MSLKPTWVDAHPLVPDIVVLGTARHGAWFWDLGQGRPHRLDSGDSWVTRARFAPGGVYFLVARMDGTLALHDCEGGVHGRLDPSHGRLTEVAWVDRERFVTTGDDGMVRWWDAGTLSQLEQRGNPGTGVTSLALAGGILAVGWEDGGMTGWVDDGPVTLSGPFRREVSAAAASPDGTLVAFGGMAGGMAVVDVATWSFAREYSTPPRQIAVNSIAWNAAGTHFVAACSDGAARIVDPGSDSLLARELGRPFWLRRPRPEWSEAEIVSSACWADEQIYTVQFDGLLRRWTPAEREPEVSWRLEDELR